MRFLVLMLLGFLLIEAGLTGKPGSLLASVIDPTDLQQNGTGS